MFHVFKQTRLYSGAPYQGPTSNGFPAEYKTLKEAKIAAENFQQRNPVGWNIFDSETGNLIDGVNMFEGW